MASGTHQECGHSPCLVVFDPSDGLLSERMFRAAIFESAQTASQFPNANQTAACSRLRKSNARQSNCADDDLPSVYPPKLILFPHRRQTGNYQIWKSQLGPSEITDVMSGEWAPLVLLRSSGRNQGDRLDEKNFGARLVIMVG